VAGDRIRPSDTVGRFFREETFTPFRGGRRMACAVVPVIELKGTKKTVKIGATKTPVIVGERINPTNRKELIAKLKAGEFGILEGEAKKQVANGADVLDINVGVPGIDEKHAMLSGSFRTRLKCLSGLTPPTLKCSRLHSRMSRGGRASTRQPGRTRGWKS
jgi:hypothetical protein